MCVSFFVVPARVELCVRRLQYWQSVAKCPHPHKTVLAVVFVKLHGDSTATVRDDGGFAVSAHGLINSKKIWSHCSNWICQPTETGFFLYSIYTGQMSWPLIVLSFARHSFLCCVPHPGVVIPRPQSEERQMQDKVGGDVDVEAGLLFACESQCDDGSTCTATFGTAQALAMHQRRTNGGTHGHVHPHVCKHVFTSLRTTQNHIRILFGCFGVLVCRQRHMHDCCPANGSGMPHL